MILRATAYKEYNILQYMGKYQTDMEGYEVFMTE